MLRADAPLRAGLWAGAGEGPWWVRPVAAAGAVGVAGYVAAWAVAGAWTPGYDPARQAISELFALGAPPGPRWLMNTALVVTGAALLGFGAVLERALPGEGRAGPVAAGIAGASTALIVLFPCTPGCPGAGASLTDAGHAVLAWTGYGSLVAAPLLCARRLRGHDDRLARLSLLLGGVAAAGLAARALGIAPGLSGLQQRVFNTVADAWYVLAAVAVLRRGHGLDGSASGRRRWPLRRTR